MTSPLPVLSVPPLFFFFLTIIFFLEEEEEDPLGDDCPELTFFLGDNLVEGEFLGDDDDNNNDDDDDEADFIWWQRRWKTDISGG